MEAGGTAGEVILRVEAILLKYGVGKGCDSGGDRLISIVFLFVIKVI